MNQYGSYLIILALIVWMSAREKTVSPGRLWIVPVLMVLAMVPALNLASITVSKGFLYILCLVAGLVIGVWRGKLEKMRIHPVSGQITSQSSVLSMIIFIIVLGLRLLAERWGQGHAMVSAANALLLIPIGSVCARRWIIYLRYQEMRGQRSL